ncbi:unnamed protein product [Malus baccata var. baccata]
MINRKSRKRSSRRTPSSSGTANQPQNPPEATEVVEALLGLSSGQIPSSSGTANQPLNSPQGIQGAQTICSFTKSGGNHQQEAAEPEQELEAQQEALQNQEGGGGGGEEVEQRPFYGIGNYVPSRLPPLPNHLLGLIQGQQCSNPFEKQMTETDVNHLYQRLILYKNDVKRYLSPLLIEKESFEEGVNVTVYDTNGVDYEMELGTWNSGTRVLAGEGWKNFRKAHGLMAYRDFLTLWMFRNADTTKLCMFISCRRLPVVQTIKRQGRRSLNHPYM